MSNLTKQEIEVYVAEYTLLADRGKKLRVFLDQKGLTTKGKKYNSFRDMPPKTQELFHILYDIKHEAYR